MISKKYRDHFFMSVIGALAVAVVYVALKQGIKHSPISNDVAEAF